MEINCPLCQDLAGLFRSNTQKEYFQCDTCGAILLSPKYYLSSEDEKKRYLKHNNDINDAGYQESVRPIVDLAIKYFNRDNLGLDYGCGEGPIVSKLLEVRGYNIKKYDPFFFDDPELLKLSYDYIVCCEVVEHFHNPQKEFKLLRQLLKKGGKLLIKTAMYSPKIDFKNWYYKNDATHVFFYQARTFEWIRTNYDFASLKTNGGVVMFNA